MFEIAPLRLEPEKNAGFCIFSSPFEESFPQIPKIETEQSYHESNPQFMEETRTVQGNHSVAIPPR
jgi:hypothetical protein